jgi:tRNA dimethylallyltransferase
LAKQWLAESDETTIVVVGPTASGKTELSLELASALDGEIVSADSVQIYRHFDLGSGKPSPSERAQARHHMIDVADPMDAFDAAMFVQQARAACNEIRARGRRPIVCGGTFLWVKALFWGLAKTPGASAEIRAKHERLRREHGPLALHDQLRVVDPTSAERLHPNDFVRVSRALEVHELSGVPLSTFHAQHAFQEVWGAPKLMARRHTPEQLTLRIQQRLQGWLGAGFQEEVRDLTARGYGESRAMASVGYKEVYACEQGAFPEAELEERAVRATRIFARRQRTWLNHEPVTWV